MQCNVRPNWFCYCSIYLIQWKLTFLFSVSRRLAEFIWEKSVGMGFSIVEFTEFVNQLQYIYLCLRTVLDFEYVKKCKHKKFSLIFSFISPFFLLYSVRPFLFFLFKYSYKSRYRRCATMNYARAMHRSHFPFNYFTLASGKICDKKKVNIWTTWWMNEIKLKLNLNE